MTEQLGGAFGGFQLEGSSNQNRVCIISQVMDKRSFENADNRQMGGLCDLQNARNTGKRGVWTTTETHSPSVPGSADEPPTVDWEFFIL